MKDSLRPIPLFITAGANANTPDSFVVYYSVARTLIAPALFTSAAGANSAYQVQSANGFKLGDLIVAITNPSGAGDCYSSRITAAVLSSGSSSSLIGAPTGAVHFDLGHRRDVAAKCGLQPDASHAGNRTDAQARCGRRA